MIELAPYDYQEFGIAALSSKINDGKRKLLYQLNTGGGKTVIFATIAWRYNVKTMNRVFILVHRKELADSTSRTLTEWYNLDHQMIEKGNKYVYDRPVYVGMVETVYKRMANNINYFPDVGIVILDEAHEGNFRKVHALFPNATILGFTATPIYTDKKYPMKNDYEDIVVGPQVNELIKRGKLCQNITYSVGTVNRNDLQVKGNDFAEGFMGSEYSRPKHVKNVIEMYESIAPGTKSICYNSSIEHSRLMTQAFNERGYKARHVDGKTPDEERDAIFDWFYDPEPTILCNVGIATMGYDNKYVRNIIHNYATMSLVKWLQCTGRGGRICPEIGKEYFSNLDMGGNAKYHLDWNEDRDWEYLFFNPPKKKLKTDAAPYKDCPNCRALIPIQSMKCKYCEFVFKIKEIIYDARPITLELVTRNLDVKHLCEVNSGHNVWYTLFQIENSLVTQVKYKLASRPITQENIELLIKVYLPLAQKWCEEVNKNWVHHESYIKSHLMEKIFKTFGYKNDTTIVDVQNVNNIQSSLFQL